MKKNMVSIKKKLIILCLFILIVPNIIIGLSSYYIAQKELDTAGETQLKKSTKFVIAMIDMLNKEVKAGHLTKEEAQEQLRQKLFGEKIDGNKRQIKEEFAFGEGGYIWAVDNTGTYVLAPETEGKNIYNTKSEDGVMVAQEALKLGEKGDFLFYKWNNIKTNKIEQKISYIEKDPNWGWTIASSAYMKEFNSGATDIAFNVSVTTFVAIILGAIIAYYVAARLTKPITRISYELHQASQGDFSGNDLAITSRDEIGILTKDFNTMKANMKNLLRHVNQSTNQVAASAEELSASAETTNKATAEITNSIQHIASAAEDTTIGLTESSQSLEEVTTAIQTLADNSTEISNTSMAIAKQAQQGNQYVEQTVKQMNSIHEKVNESGVVMKLLDTNSNEIGAISKVITDIADQTNLLALNAAIEAARAGEHGKGFAVVADEVRKLAEQSQISSQQISDLIKDIQKNMSSSTQSMDQVKLEVTEGLEIVAKTEMSFQEIVVALENMKIKVTEMAASVDQMSASSQEVSATLSNNVHLTKEASAQTQLVAAATEEQLAIVEEISISSNSLSKLSGELQELMNKFKI